MIDKQHVLHINSPLNVVVPHNADEWPRRDVTVVADFMNEKEFSVFRNADSGRASRGMEHPLVAGALVQYITPESGVGHIW